MVSTTGETPKPSSALEPMPMTDTAINAKQVGRVTHLHLHGMLFYLSEQDVRRMRAEMNRILEKIADKRKATV